MCQAHCKRLFRAETFGGEEPAAGLRLADLRDHEGRDGGGREAEADFGEAELGAGPRNDEIRAGDEADSTAEHIAVGDADYRLRAIIYGRQHVGQPHRVGAVFGVAGGCLGAHPVGVGAGAEAGAVASQQDGADGRIAPKLLKCLGEAEDRLGGEGVVFFGAVERDGGQSVGASLHHKHDISHGIGAHIRNKPKRVSGISAFSATARLSASTFRVSSGAMIPSSQSLAEA